MNDYIAFSAYFGAALTLIIYVVSFRISDRTFPKSACRRVRH